jgi:hypothetical protein
MQFTDSFFAILCVGSPFIEDKSVGKDKKDRYLL